MKKWILFLWIVFLAAAHGADIPRELSSLKIFKVDDYGANGFDDIPDSDAIQKCRNVALAAGGGRIQFSEHGVYLLTYSTGMTGDRLIYEGAGEGATLKAADNTDFRGGLMNGVAKKNLVIRNLTFDGNLARRKSAKLEMSGINLIACQKTLIDHCTFKDLGRWSSIASTNCISVAQYETSPQDSEDIEIRDCRFYDPLNRIKFGIRLTTDWTDPKEILNRHIRNVKISGCLFVNGFMWNCIEIAGPATTDVNVSDCISMGHKKYCSFEADKGAKNISFTRCQVYDQKDETDAAWAFNVSGQPSDADKKHPHPERRAQNITFTDCIAKNISSPSHNGIGYRFVFCDHVTVQGGSIEGINTNPKHSAFYDYNATDIRISNVRISHCHNLYVHVNHQNIQGLSFYDNIASTVKGFCMRFADGKKDDITIKNNRIAIDDASHMGAIDINCANNISIIGNTLSKTKAPAKNDRAAIVIRGIKSSGVIKDNTGENFKRIVDTLSPGIKLKGNTVR